MQHKTNNLIIGILAHVDAGKTTLTENLLFYAQAIRQLGRVDDGTSKSDWLDVEKERGISVRTSNVSFSWNDYSITLVDTPGHVDFSSEVERSLSILDGAVLVISAVDGVQPQTELIIEALQKLKIPFIIFLNKTDRAGSDIDLVVSELEKDFKINCFNSYSVDNEESTDVKISKAWNEEDFKNHPGLIERIVECNETLLEKYFSNNDLTFDELNQTMQYASHNQSLVQLIPGSAKTSTGIKELLESIIMHLPSTPVNDKGDLSGVVYKIMHDDRIGRLVGIRLNHGCLRVRDSISSKNGNHEKVSVIRKYNGQDYNQVDALNAGEIGFIAGLSSLEIGDFIGSKPASFKEFHFDAPLLTIQVYPAKDADYPLLAEALRHLSIEDPLLDFEWLRVEKELHIKIRGTVQLEVLGRILESRFNLKAEFGKPTVIYKETISKPGYGYEAYTMPKPCWAIVKFFIKPGERGSGVVYNSDVSVNKIKQRYQNEVDRTISRALKQGIKGWEVTDVKITLIDGEDHEIHSNPGDFILATPIGIMKALEESGTTLLEPILDFRIAAPEDTLGKIAAELHRMRATFENPQFENGKVLVLGQVPLSTSMDFPVRLGSITGGKGKFSSRFAGYQPINDELGKVRPFRGISPLDRSKYILKMRGAITE